MKMMDGVAVASTKLIDDHDICPGHPRKEQETGI